MPLPTKQKQKPEESGLAIFIGTTAPTAPEDNADAAYTSVAFLTSIDFPFTKTSLDARTFENGAWQDSIDGDLGGTISIEGVFRFGEASNAQDTLRAAATTDGQELYYWVGTSQEGAPFAYGRCGITSYNGGMTGTRGEIMPFSAEMETRGAITTAKNAVTT